MPIYIFYHKRCFVFYQKYLDFCYNTGQFGISYSIEVMTILRTIKHILTLFPMTFSAGFFYSGKGSLPIENSLNEKLKECNLAQL